MNTNNAICDTNQTSKEKPPHILSEITLEMLKLAVVILSDMAEDQHQRQMERKQAKKDQCVALIMEAKMSGQRISPKRLFEIIPSLSYCATRADIARYLGISIDEFNVGVKRWYHFF